MVRTRQAVLAAFALSLGVQSGCSSGDPPLAGAERAVPRTRHQLDTQRNRIWVLDRDGAYLYDLAAPDRARHVPLPSWQSVGEPSGCAPALALGPRGEVLVSSDVMRSVWRIDPDSTHVTEHELTLDADVDKEVGFSALAYVSEQRIYIGFSHFHGTLWRIDPASREAHRIALDAPLSRACGIAITARGQPRRKGARAQLCVETVDGITGVDLAPDGRSAMLRPQACGLV
jgi:hypothetical protein